MHPCSSEGDEDITPPEIPHYNPQRQPADLLRQIQDLNRRAPGGGVAVSGLETSQNSERRSWKEAELQQLLLDIMEGIHGRCVEYGGTSGGNIDYVRGAKIAGFKKVADAMLAYGVV